MEREVGGGIGMGNTCKPMDVSFQCMTKSTTQKKKNRIFFFKTFSFFFFPFWLFWVFIAARRLFPAMACGGYSVVAVLGASHCGGFSCGAWALGTWTSVIAALWAQ